MLCIQDQQKKRMVTGWINELEINIICDDSESTLNFDEFRIRCNKVKNSTASIMREYMPFCGDPQMPNFVQRPGTPHEHH